MRCAPGLKDPLSIYALYRFTIIVVFLGTWEFLVYSHVLDEFFVPRPSAVYTRILEILFTRQYLDQLIITLSTFVMGLIIGSILGLILGFFIGSMRYLRNFVMVYILLIAATPKILYYPIIVKIFVEPFYFKVAFVALHAFIFVIITVVSTIRNLNPDLLLMCKIYGCNSIIKIYKKVFWPYAYFSYLCALRMATISSLVGSLVADMIIAPGVGYTVRLLAYNFKVVDVYSLIILVALFAITLNFVLLKVEENATKRLHIAQTSLIS